MRALAGAFAIGLLAASVSQAESVISAESLARVEATLAVCVALDPAATEQYQTRGRLLTAGIDSKVVAQLRDTSGYKDTYESAHRQLEDAPPDQVLQACRAFLAGTH